jgi:hypothetical protein
MSFSRKFTLCVYAPVHNRSQDSVVGIATSYGLYDRGVGVRVPVGSRFFSSPKRPDRRSTQPPIQWVPGALSPGVKQPEREVDHSPPTSTEVKKMWIYTSTPIRLHGVVLNYLSTGTNLPFTLTGKCNYVLLLNVKKHC